jgi:hypothetical protein
VNFISAAKVARLAKRFWCQTQETNGKETIKIKDAAGIHDLFFVFRGDMTENSFKLDYYSVSYSCH